MIIDQEIIRYPNLFDPNKKYAGYIELRDWKIKIKKIYDKDFIDNLKLCYAQIKKVIPLEKRHKIKFVVINPNMFRDTLGEIGYFMWKYDPKYFHQSVEIS